MILFVKMQWLETETVRLSHLRDRASDMGRKKEYPFLLVYEAPMHFICNWVIVRIRFIFIHAAWFKIDYISFTLSFVL